MANDLREKGALIRQQLWGNDPQTKAQTERMEAFHKDLGDFIQEQLFGGIWSRPGLPLKTRSLITVAALMAMGRGPQLRAHMRGALNIGITPGELKEVILHLSQYSGMPTAVEAVRILQELLEAP
ncbi:MAG TPA: carboxymuconolactone decarboxylase family protein [Candidatus Binataceae bacterium]|nr:carboxymuconolactone decarboxylase family protein [Candidatus Binataceae bacterium]